MDAFRHHTLPSQNETFSTNICSVILYAFADDMMYNIKQNHFQTA